MTTANPITLQAAVRTALLASGSLTALLGTLSVKAGYIPSPLLTPATQLPGITLSSLYADEDTVGRGQLASIRLVIQRDVWVSQQASGHVTTAWQIHGLARAALNTSLSATGWRQIKARSTKPEAIEHPDEGLYRVSDDLIVVATPSV